MVDYIVVNFQLGLVLAVPVCKGCNYFITGGVKLRFLLFIILFFYYVVNGEKVIPELCFHRALSAKEKQIRVVGKQGAEYIIQLFFVKVRHKDFIRHIIDFIKNHIVCLLFRDSQVVIIEFIGAAITAGRFRLGK